MPEQKVRDLTRAEMAVLATLVSKERYGLDIVRTLRDKGQALSLAGLYTTLARLERDGFVTSRWGEENVDVRQGARRRYYALNGLGEKALRQTTAVMRRVLRTVPSIARAAGVPA